MLRSTSYSSRNGGLPRTSKEANGKPSFHNMIWLARPGVMCASPFLVQSSARIKSIELGVDIGHDTMGHGAFFVEVSAYLGSLIGHGECSWADYNLEGTLPASRQAHVEYLDDCGKWRKQSGTQARDSNALVLHKSKHILEANPVLNDHPAHQDHLKGHEKSIDFSVPAVRDIEAVSHTSLSQDFNSVYRPISPSVDLDEFFTNSMSWVESSSLDHTYALGVDDDLLWHLPLSCDILNGPLDLSPFLIENSVGSPIQRSITSENDHPEWVHERSISVVGTKSNLEGARCLIKSLVRHGKITQCYQTTTAMDPGIPDVDEIMEKLESLIPETATTSREAHESTLSMKDASSSSHLFNTFIYSFTNNFAGLRDVPRRSLMQLLRDRHDIRTQLFEIIKSGKPGVAKPLADNLFRAAIEGCDADAAATIIHHIKSNPKLAIDPNEIVCNLEGEDYTPIELAGKFRNTELVRTILAFRADPNKTYRREHDKYWKKGALALALGHWENGSVYPFKESPTDEPEPVSLDLLRLLLDCGAEVRVDLLENAMRPGPGHTAVAEELISRVPATDHQMWFESEWLLICLIHYLEDRAADKIVRRLFAHCDSTNCSKCISANPKMIERMLCHAARRSNIKLSQFLVQHTTKLQSALAAAIRAGCAKLAQFFLDRGAHVDDPVEPWHHPKKFRDPYGGMYNGMFDENGYDRPLFTTVPFEYVVTPIRTPLAEAIRARDDHLINTFVTLGGLAPLSDETHFQAAVLAAVEVGNASYLKIILDRGLRPLEGACLTLALAVAIRNDETDVALILLDAGASPYNCRSIHGTPVISALERRNKRVVEPMLECDVYHSPRVHGDEKFALEVAASWCEVDMIEDFIRLGSGVRYGIQMTPLAAAVRFQNRSVVQLLLEHKSSHPGSVMSPEGVFPLQAALEIRDYDMVRFLILNGVDPAEYSAFEYAIRHDSAGYQLLLSEFKSHHPNGLPGFFGPLLSKAIELDSHSLIDSLLGTGADVNSWCTRRPFHPRRIYEDGSMNNQRVLGFAIKHQKGQCHELVRKLLTRGAEPDYIVSEYEVSNDHGRICVLETALIVAVKTRNLRLVNLLLEYGAELNRPARRGLKQTPLQAACETGSYKMVEFLLQRGANVNSAAAERHGGTALQMAAKTGSLKIVKLLLDNGADPHMAKSKVGGRTAFEAAAENGCLDILYLVWNAVLPFGFGEKECQSAKDFAKQKGHRGCVDFIDFLSGGSSQSFLDQ